MYWKKSDQRFVTPGGDPVWQCPVCGSRHVYGIEHPHRKEECDDCGAKLKYPWLAKEYGTPLKIVKEREIK